MCVFVCVCVRVCEMYLSQFINKLKNGRAHSSLPASPLLVTCVCSCGSLFGFSGTSTIAPSPFLSIPKPYLASLSLFLIQFRLHSLFFNHIPAES